MLARERTAGYLRPKKKQRTIKVSVKTKILPVAICALLCSPAVVSAKTKWDCRAGPNNTWECSKDGGRPLATSPRPANQGDVTTTPLYESSFEANEQSEDTSTASESSTDVTTSEYNAPVIGQRQLEAGNTLRIDRDLDWNQCGPLNDPAANAPRYSGETQITADAADVSRENKQATFTGNVVVTKDDQLLEADRITYNNKADTMDIAGSIYFQSPGLLVSGDSAKMNMGNSTGQIENAQYRLPKRRARGSASLVNIEGRDKSSYKNIDYTTCRPGKDDWILEAGQLEIDKGTGVGVAHDAVFRFKGIPFFYLPYASFPIDDRRKSGFLVPSIGSSDSTGADISVPYYINIAPDMDATIVPRIMSKRGLMIGGEFRYLAKDYYAETKLEILPDDRERDSGENSTRGAFSYYGHGFLSPRVTLNANINYASDNDYLEDLGDSLAIASSRYLERRGDIRYHGNNWNILARAQYYQTMDETILRQNRPYARLPQIKFAYEQPEQFGGVTLHMNAEYVYFDKDESVSGHRIDLQPAISYPMRNSWGYLTPKLGARYTSYDLKDQFAGLSDSPDRSTGTFSLDGGLFFEKVGENNTHTLEPRMFYLYTSKADQDDIPIFDTSAYDFSFYNLFREDRFAGADRVGDANQLALALTSRTYDNKTGEESFRFSLGEVFYFEDREVLLTDPLHPASATVLSASDDSSSAMIGQVAWQISNNWSTQADIEWDHNRDHNKTAQSAFHLRYDSKKNTLLNLGYRYARDYEADGVLFEQTDLSFRLPITSHINAVGRWDYSLLHDKTMESFAGLEYSNCCWALRVVGRHYINDIDLDANTAFYLQLELKGLTSIGDKVGEFLEDNILGYTRAD